MRLKAFGCLAALTFLSLTPAEAAVLVYTYTGTVLNGYDTGGDFGSPDTTLTGDTFKVVETFDLSKAPFIETDGLTYSKALGGDGFPGSATSQVTINGVIDLRTIFGNYVSDILNFASSNHFDEVDEREDLRDTYTYFSVYNVLTPYSYTDPIPATYASASDGYFEDSYTPSDQPYVSIAFADLKIDTMTVAFVPLPSAAPLFGAALIALGAAGYAAKRKKAAAT